MKSGLGVQKRDTKERNKERKSTNDQWTIRAKKDFFSLQDNDSDVKGKQQQQPQQ